MTAPLHLTVRGTSEALRRVADELDAFADVNELPPAMLHPVQIALDELLSNTVKSGGEKSGDPCTIEVSVQLSEEGLEVTVLDDSEPFDPLQRAAPDTSLALEDRAIGGLGLMLIEQLMDDVDYELKNGRNCLRLIKRTARGWHSGDRAVRTRGMVEIEEDKQGDVIVVELKGRLDSTTTGDVEAAVMKSLDAGAGRLLFDMAGVEYISSAGLLVLLLTAKRLRGSGQLVLCALTPSVEQVLDRAGFTPLFAIEESREQALARIAS